MCPTRSLRPYSAAGFDPAGRASGPSRTSKICGVHSSLASTILLYAVDEPFHGDPPLCLARLWLRRRFVQTRPPLASSWLLRDRGGLASTHTLSETITLSTWCRAYLPSEAPFLLDPLPGIGLLLFGFESQKFLLFSSFLIIAIEDILDLSAMFRQISTRNHNLRDRRSTIELSGENSPYRSNRSSSAPHVPSSPLHGSRPSPRPGFCHVRQEYHFDHR